jgi:asparagine synthetase B (glutamine-hydrolysing)
MVPRSQTEDDRSQTEVAHLSEQRTQQLNDRKELQSQIDELVTPAVRTRMCCVRFFPGAALFSG